VELPQPRHAALADYRVLILDDLPGVALDSEIRAALHERADALEKRGAQVARKTDRLPDLAKAREVFGGLLNTAMSRRQPGAKPIDAHQWLDLLDAQIAIRRQWSALFEGFDVVLAPTFGVVAFPHVTEEDPARRVLTVDGRETPYFDQLAWPGVALVANLPATACPIGFTKAGLPIGAQVIGPYLEDRATIGFAGLMEREFGGFVAPPRL
jgi:amidase